MTSIPRNDSEREIRVLVADDDVILAERVVDFLANNGFYTRYARTGIEAKNILLTWRPDFILCDLMLPELNAFQLLKYVNTQFIGDHQIQVIVLSGHSQEANVRECLRHGAADYLVKPVKYVDLLARLVLHAQQKRSLKEFVEAPPGGQNAETDYYLHLVDLALKEALKNVQNDEILYNLTRMVALALKAVRVSVVHCDPETRVGQVLGSSDLRNVKSLRLDLSKYPEILYTVQSQKLLALDNLSSDPTMAFLTRQHKSISFNSMIVAPIRFHSNSVWGVLSARMPDTKTSLTDSEIRFTQAVSQIIGLVLLKDRTQVAMGRTG